MIRIPSRSILIVNFGWIWNPMTNSSWWSRIRSNINHFRSKFDLFWLKDWYRDWKSQLNNWSSPLKDRKIQFLLKKLIYIEKKDQIWPFLIKINLKLNFSIFFICWNQFHCDDSDSNNNFRSKKLIKMLFKYNSIQILAGGWLNRISLQWGNNSLRGFFGASSCSKNKLIDK